MEAERERYNEDAEADDVQGDDRCEMIAGPKKG